MPLCAGTDKRLPILWRQKCHLRLLNQAAFWTGVITVVATAIAALTGSLSWYFSNRVAKAKNAELSQFQSEARVAIAEADARAAEADEKAERERLARIRLEETVAPSRLTMEQQHAIASKLLNFSGQVVSLWFGSGDKEAETFALRDLGTGHANRIKI